MAGVSAKSGWDWHLSRCVRNSRGCLIWPGRKSQFGYGTFRRDGKTILAHREAWLRANPGQPAPSVVRHECDIRPCVEPDHLLPGTQSDNVQDAVDRGRNRGAVGIQNAKAKLNDELVQLIREKSTAGRSHVVLGHEFGVSPENIGFIVRRVTWKHVP